MVISKEIQDIGRFFGEVEGYVMEDLVEIKVFKRDRIYDFQALCKDETDSLKTNDGNGLITVNLKAINTKSKAVIYFACIYLFSHFDFSWPQWNGH